MTAILTYFRESLEELRLVQWPTQQQAIRLTVITVVFILVSSIFFGVIDAFFSELIRLTIRI
jgi:preprotein translocase SecE subunit